MHGLAWRLYWSAPQSVDDNGVDSGMLNAARVWLAAYLRTQAPHFVAACFDSRTSWRKEIYPKYKANRKPAPDALKAQLGQLEDTTAACGIKCLGANGFEADDVIATLSASFSLVADIEIVSCDKDLMQLVCDAHGGRHAITQIDPRDGTRIGPAQVEERLGVHPDRVLDLLALMGDAADGYPGVPGVGKVAARKIIRREPVSDRITALVEANTEAFLLSRGLATLVRDVPLSVKLKDLIYLPKPTEAT